MSAYQHYNQLVQLTGSCHAADGSPLQPYLANIPSSENEDQKQFVNIKSHSRHISLLECSLIEQRDLHVILCFLTA